MGTPRFNRVVAGDCVEGMRALDDGCVDLVFTSPPYADLRDYARSHGSAGSRRSRRRSKTDRRDGRIRPDDYVGWFLPVAYEIKRVLKARGSFVLNINDRCVRGARHLYVFRLVVAIADIVGMPLVETYVWHKPNPMPGRYGPRPKDAFEYVFWFGKARDVKFDLRRVARPAKKRSGSFRAGVRRRVSGRPMRESNFARRTLADPGNVITCPVARGTSRHPARMPEALAEFFIQLATKPGDVVLDPFLGSGTTARVSSRLGRRWVGFELHPELVSLE